MKFNRTIIISAVNLVNGGTFTILKDCLEQISKNPDFSSYRIVALVNSIDVMKKYSNIEYLEYPSAKKNYLLRCFYEYIYFFILSLKYKPRIWLSLHDMTPFVKAEKQFVYMHNPSPFYMHDKGEELSLKFRFFVKFYKFVYRINVHRNTALIVQQDWLRNEMSNLCKFPKEKIIVAYPEISDKGVESSYKKNSFFYASFPREFKNFEIICKACCILEEKKIQDDWIIYVTIDGTENTYSNKLINKYSDLKHLKFVGLLSPEDVYYKYNESECLIFPSKLETWGLPISEFKVSGKKMILADMPYAHETANDSDQVAFFAANNEQELSSLIQNVIEGDNSKFLRVSKKNIERPFSDNWQELLHLLESF